MLDSGPCDEIKVLGYPEPPHMRLTTGREPRGRPNRPASRNHILHHTNPPPSKHRDEGERSTLPIDNTLSI